MDVALFYSPVLGRFLIGFFFVFFGVWNTCHWRPTLDFMLQKKIPFSFACLWFGITLQTVTGLMLIVNSYVKIAALLLIPFDIVSVLIFHAFWNFEGEIRRLNMIIFFANLTGTLGALLLLLNTIEPSANITALLT